MQSSIVAGKLLVATLCLNHPVCQAETELGMWQEQSSAVSRKSSENDFRRWKIDVSAKDAKRQKWSVGSVVEIPLDNGKLAYAVVLEFPLIAFLDPKIYEHAPVANIQQSEVIFSLWVMKYAITKGHWRIVDRITVPEFLKVPPVFYRQKIGSGDFLFYYTDGREEPATYDQIRDLELASVWDPEHIEDRLNDYLAGRKNKWVESLRPVPKK